jgi:proteasome lid subunit RPN8/RPN11
MNILTDNLKSRIKAHALSEAPYECCGIIVESDGNVKALSCKNVAVDKQNEFEVSGKDYLRALREGEIKAYYHSHTNGNPILSIVDEVLSRAHDLPLIMYCTSNNNFTEYQP